MKRSHTLGGVWSESDIYALLWRVIEMSVGCSKKGFPKVVSDDHINTGTLLFKLRQP